MGRGIFVLFGVLYLSVTLTRGPLWFLLLLLFPGSLTMSMTEKPSVLAVGWLSHA